MLKRTAYNLIAALLITSVPLGRSNFPLSASSGSKEKAAKREASQRKASSKTPSCAVCPRVETSPSDSPLGSYAKSGGHTQAYPFQPLTGSTFEGSSVNLVNTSNGSLTFRVEDLSLNNGPLPIIFSRAYASDRREDYGLGKGWSFLFDDRITIDQNTAAMTTGTGAVISFRRDGQSNRFVLEIPESGFHQYFDVTDKGDILELANGFSRTYGKIGATYRLRQIADPNGNQVDIGYDQRGNLISIAGSGGKISIRWSGGKKPQIRSVTDSAGRRVRFKQSEHLLRAVIDPTGTRWTYDYDDSGLLTLGTDPVGRKLLHVNYNKSGWVVEAGDAVGASRYEYTLWSEGSRISRRTVVTDPMGALTTFEQNESGALVGIRADEATTLRIEYNSANRPERIVDATGEEVNFRYDSQNRLVREWSSTGMNNSFSFDESGYLSSVTEGDSRTVYRRDERGNIIAADTGNPTSSYTAVRNQRGQPISLTPVMGHPVSLEYDATGNTSAYSYSDLGRFVEEHDGAGRLTTTRLPSALTIHREYDARGNLAKVSNNRGKWKVFERDASGLITRVNNQDGQWSKASRDEVGRITSVTNWKGEASRFSYDGRGALTEFTDVEGETYKITYDSRGRLVSIYPDEIWIASCNDGCCCLDYDVECGFGTDCVGDGGDGGGDGGGGETCQQCIDRQVQICEATKNACVDTVYGAYATALAACALTGAFALVCAAAATVAAVAGVASCNNTAEACRLGARDHCSSCT